MFHIFISSIFILSTVSTPAPAPNSSQEMEDEEDVFEDEDMFYLEEDKSEDSD